MVFLGAVNSLPDSADKEALMIVAKLDNDHLPGTVNPEHTSRVGSRVARVALPFAEFRSAEESKPDSLK